MLPCFRRERPDRFGKRGKSGKLFPGRTPSPLPHGSSFSNVWRPSTDTRNRPEFDTFPTRTMNLPGCGDSVHVCPRVQQPLGETLGRGEVGAACRAAPEWSQSRNPVGWISRSVHQRRWLVDGPGGPSYRVTWCRFHEVPDASVRDKRGAGSSMIRVDRRAGIAASASEAAAVIAHRERARSGK